MNRALFPSLLLALVTSASLCMDIPKLQKEVEEIRGLKFRRAVAVQNVTADEMRRVIKEALLEDIPEKELPKYEEALKAFKLIPAGTDLRRTMETLLGGQVVGLYDPKGKKLYVVKGGRPPEADSFFDASSGLDLEEMSVVHELDHALTDQNFDLEKSLDLRDIDNIDRQAASLAVAEGDATLVMFRFLSRKLDLQGVKLEEMSDLFLKDGLLEELFGKSCPRYLRETLLFSYMKGLALVTAVEGAGGFKAVDSLYAHPPVSTEEVLHPEKILKNMDPPRKIAAPGARAGRGTLAVSEGTWGELGTRIILREWGAGEDAARSASEGWGGDRFTVTKNGSGETAFEWRTCWDSERDASEFESAVPKEAGFTVVRDGAEVLVGSGPWQERDNRKGGKR